MGFAQADRARLAPSRGLRRRSNMAPARSESSECAGPLAGEPKMRPRAIRRARVRSLLRSNARFQIRRNRSRPSHAVFVSRRGIARPSRAADRAPVKDSKARRLWRLHVCMTDRIRSTNRPPSGCRFRRTSDDRRPGVGCRARRGCWSARRPACHECPQGRFESQEVLAPPCDPVAEVLGPLLQCPADLTAEHVHPAHIGCFRDLFGRVAVLGPPHPPLEGSHLSPKRAASPLSSIFDCKFRPRWNQQTCRCSGSRTNSGPRISVTTSRLRSASIR
ncbi:hypothetical protein SAMN02745121_08349 [Nannocystis exedens]|uniref:Uncharacterized protein n=1 Tax=Nannocystis exedens TaxID=54 RepID=A0A1I2I1R2_9BACT|nr:hypothetical protein NAEX_06614 [Nannocystis exedens]SFF35580.1 hypothetical protein SAMN02745121_08349 [Nannocystis exedens]